MKGCIWSCRSHAGNRDVDKSAACVLYRYGLDTKTFERLDTAEFVQYGFAGLIEHTETGDSEYETAVYYAQAPVAVYQYPAYNPDLSNYDSEDSENYLPEFRGDPEACFADGGRGGHGYHPF